MMFLLQKSPRRPEVNEEREGAQRPLRRRSRLVLLGLVAGRETRCTGVSSPSRARGIQMCRARFPFPRAKILPAHPSTEPLFPTSASTTASAVARAEDDGAATTAEPDGSEAAAVPNDAAVRKASGMAAAAAGITAGRGNGDAAYPSLRLEPQVRRCAGFFHDWVWHCWDG